MKFSKILILTILLLVNCSKGKNDKPTNNSIIGTWKLTEQWLGNVDSNSTSWGEVTNGYNMTFSNDGSYNSNEFTACQNDSNNGYFSLSENTSNRFVETSFECQSSNNSLTRVYSYNFEGEFLILSPYSNPCPEGCKFKFRRVN